MAFSTEVDVLTMEDIMPDVVDTVLRANTFTTRIMLKDTKKFRAATQDFPKLTISPYADQLQGILMGK